MSEVENTSRARNAPASIEPGVSAAALWATARYISAQLSRLFGLPQIPADELEVEFTSGGSGRRRQPFGGRGIAFPGTGQVFVNPRFASNAVLAHELTHIYLGRLLPITEEYAWIHEGLAHYAKDVLGYGGGKNETPIIGDPTEG